MLLCLFIIKIAHIYSSSRYYNGYLSAWSAILEWQITR